MKKSSKLFSFLAIALSAFLLAGSIGSFKGHTAEANVTTNQYYKSVSIDTLKGLSGGNHYIEYGEYPQSEITDGEEGDISDDFKTAITTALSSSGYTFDTKNSITTLYNDRGKLNGNYFTYDSNTGYFTATQDIIHDGIVVLKKGEKIYEYISGVNALEKYPYYKIDINGLEKSTSDMTESIRSAKKTDDDTSVYSNSLNNYYYYNSDGDWNKCDCTFCGGYCKDGQPKGVDGSTTIFTYEENKTDYSINAEDDKDTFLNEKLTKFKDDLISDNLINGKTTVTFYESSISGTKAANVVKWDYYVKYNMKVTYIINNHEACLYCYDNHNHTKKAVDAGFAGRQKGEIVYYTNGVDTSNGYNAGQRSYFKVEPIKWRIVENKDGIYTLQSDTIIDSMYFNPYQNNGNDFETSYLRGWLNYGSDDKNLSLKINPIDMTKGYKDDNGTYIGIGNTIGGFKVNSDVQDVTTYSVDRYAFQDGVLGSGDDKYKYTGAYYTSEKTYKNNKPTFYKMAFSNENTDVLQVIASYNGKDKPYSYVTLPERYYDYNKSDNDFNVLLNSKKYTDYAKATGLVCQYNDDLTEYGNDGSYGLFWTSGNSASINSNGMTLRGLAKFSTGSDSLYLVNDSTNTQVNQSAGVIPVIKIDINELVGKNSYIVDKNDSGTTGHVNKNTESEEGLTSRLLAIVDRSDNVTSDITLTRYAVEDNSTNDRITATITFDKNNTNYWAGNDFVFLKNNYLKFVVADKANFTTNGSAKYLTDSSKAEVMIGTGTDGAYDTNNVVVNASKGTVSITFTIGNNLNAKDGVLVYAYVISADQSTETMIANSEIKTASYQMSEGKNQDLGNKQYVYEGQLVSLLRHKIVYEGSTTYTNWYLDKAEQINIFDKDAQTNANLFGDNERISQNIAYSRVVGGWVENYGDDEQLLNINTAYVEYSKELNISLYSDYSGEPYNVVFNFGGSSNRETLVRKIFYIDFRGNEIVPKSGENEDFSVMYNSELKFRLVVKPSYVNNFINVDGTVKSVADLGLLGTYAGDPLQYNPGFINIKVTDTTGTTTEAIGIDSSKVSSGINYYGGGTSGTPKEVWYEINAGAIGSSTVIRDGENKMNARLDNPVTITFGDIVEGWDTEGNYTVGIEGEGSRFMRFEDTTGGNISAENDSITNIPQNSKLEANLKLKPGYELQTGTNGLTLPTMNFSYGAPVLDAQGYRISQHYTYKELYGELWNSSYKDNYIRLDADGNALDIDNNGNLKYKLSLTTDANIESNENTTYHNGFYLQYMDSDENNGKIIEEKILDYFVFPILYVHIENESGSKEFNGKSIRFIPNIDGSGEITYKLDNNEVDNNYKNTHPNVSLSHVTNTEGERYWSFTRYSNESSLKMNITHDINESIKYCLAGTGKNDKYYLTAEYRMFKILKSGESTEVNDLKHIAVNYDRGNFEDCIVLSATNDGTYSYVGQDSNSKPVKLYPSTNGNYNMWIQYVDNMSFDSTVTSKEYEKHTVSTVSTGLTNVIWNGEYRNWFYIDANGKVQIGKFVTMNREDYFYFDIGTNDETKYQVVFKHNGMYYLDMSYNYSVNNPFNTTVGFKPTYSSDDLIVFYTLPVMAEITNYKEDVDDEHLQGDTYIKLTVNNIVSDIVFDIDKSSITEIEYQMNFKSNFSNSNLTTSLSLNPEYTVKSGLGVDVTKKDDYKAFLDRFKSDIVDDNGEVIFVPFINENTYYYTAPIDKVAGHNNEGIGYIEDGETITWTINIGGSTRELKKYGDYKYIDDVTKIEYLFTDKVYEFIGWKVSSSKGDVVINNTDPADNIYTNDEILNATFTFGTSRDTLIFEASYQEKQYDIEVYSWMLGKGIYNVLEENYNDFTGNIEKIEDEDKYILKSYKINDTNIDCNLTFGSTLYIQNGTFLYNITGENDTLYDSITEFIMFKSTHQERPVGAYANFKGMFKYINLDPNKFAKVYLDEASGINSFTSLNAIKNKLIAKEYTQTTVWGLDDFYKNKTGNVYVRVTENGGVYSVDLYSQFEFKASQEFVNSQVGGLLASVTGTPIDGNLKLYAIFEDKAFNVTTSGFNTDAISYEADTKVQLNNNMLIKYSVVEKYNKSLINSEAQLNDTITDNDEYLANVYKFINLLNIEALTYNGQLSFKGGAKGQAFTLSNSYATYNGEDYFKFEIGNNASINFSKDLTTFIVSIPNVIGEVTISFIGTEDSKESPNGTLDEGEDRNGNGILDSFAFTINTYTVTFADPANNPYGISYGKFLIGYYDASAEANETWDGVWTYTEITSENIDTVNTEKLGLYGVSAKLDGNKIVLTVNYEARIRFMFVQDSAFEGYYVVTGADGSHSQPISINGVNTFADCTILTSYDDAVSWNGYYDNSYSFLISDDSDLISNNEAQYQINSITEDIEIEFVSNIKINTYEITDDRGENNYYSYEVVVDEIKDGDTVVNQDNINAGLIDHGNNANIVYTIDPAYTQTIASLKVDNNYLVLFVDRFNYVEGKYTFNNVEITLNEGVYTYTYNEIDYTISEYDDNYLLVKVGSHELGYIGKYDADNADEYVFRFVNVKADRTIRLVGNFINGAEEWPLNTYNISVPTNSDTDNNGSMNIVSKVNAGSTGETTLDSLTATVKHGDSLNVVLTYNVKYTHTLPTFIINDTEYQFKLSGAGVGVDSDERITNTIEINGITIVITQIVTKETKFDNIIDNIYADDDLKQFFGENLLYSEATYEINVSNVTGELTIGVDYSVIEDNKYLFIFNQVIGRDAENSITGEIIPLEFEGRIYYQYITHGELATNPFTSNNAPIYVNGVQNGTTSAFYNKEFAGYILEDEGNIYEGYGDDLNTNDKFVFDTTITSSNIVYALFTEETYTLKVGNGDGYALDAYGKLEIIDKNDNSITTNSSIKYTDTENLSIKYTYKVAYDKNNEFRFTLTPYGNIPLPGDSGVSTLTNVGDYTTYGTSPVYVIKKVSEENGVIVYNYYYNSDYSNGYGELFRITINTNRLVENRNTELYSTKSYTLTFVRKIDAGAIGANLDLLCGVPSDIDENTYEIKFHKAQTTNPIDATGVKVINNLNNPDFIELTNEYIYSDITHGVAINNFSTYHNSAAISGYNIVGWYSADYNTEIISNSGYFKSTNTNVIYDDCEVWAKYEKATFKIYAGVRASDGYDDIFSNYSTSNLEYESETTVTFTLSDAYNKNSHLRSDDFIVKHTGATGAEDDKLAKITNVVFNRDNGTYTVYVKYAIADAMIVPKSGLTFTANTYTVTVYNVGSNPNEIGSQIESLSGIRHGYTASSKKPNSTELTTPDSIDGYTFQGWIAIKSDSVGEANRFAEMHNNLQFFDGGDYSYYTDGVLSLDRVLAVLRGADYILSNGINSETGEEYTTFMFTRTPITHDVAVYPLYTRNLVTITIDVKTIEGNELEENGGALAYKDNTILVPYGAPLLDNETYVYEQTFKNINNSLNNNLEHYVFSIYSTPTKESDNLSDIKATADMTLVIKYARATYTVTLTNKDASSIVTIEVKYNDGISMDTEISSIDKGSINAETVGEWINALTSTMPGSSLKGWILDGGGNESVNGEDIQIASNCTYTADIVYKKYNFIIEINPSNGATLDVAIGDEENWDIDLRADAEVNPRTPNINISHDQPLTLLFIFKEGHTAPPTLEFYLNGNYDQPVDYSEIANTVHAEYSSELKGYYITITNFKQTLLDESTIEVKITGNKQQFELDNIVANDIDKVTNAGTTTYSFVDEAINGKPGYVVGGIVPVFFDYGVVYYGEAFEFNVYISNAYTRSTKIKFTLSDGNKSESFITGSNGKPYITNGVMYTYFTFVFSGVTGNITLTIDDSSEISQNLYIITYYAVYGGGVNGWVIDKDYEHVYIVDEHGNGVNFDAPTAIPANKYADDYRSDSVNWRVNVLGGGVGISNDITTANLNENFVEFIVNGYNYASGGDIVVYHFFLIEQHEVTHSEHSSDKGSISSNVWADGKIYADQRTDSNADIMDGYKFGYTIREKYSQNAPIISIIGNNRKYDLVTIGLDVLSSMATGEIMNVKKTDDLAYAVTKLANGYKYSAISIARSAEEYTVSIEGGVYTFILGEEVLASGAYSEIVEDNETLRTYNFTLNRIDEAFTLDVNDEMYKVNVYAVTFKHVDGSTEVKEVEYDSSLTHIPTDTTNFIQKLVYVVTYADGTQEKLTSKKLAKLQIKENLNVEIKVELNFVVLISIIVGALVVIIVLIVLIVRAKNNRQDRSRSQRSNMEMFDRLSKAKENEQSKKSDKPYNPYIDNSKNNNDRR